MFSIADREAPPGHALGVNDGLSYAPSGTMPERPPEAQCQPYGYQGKGRRESDPCKISMRELVDVQALVAETPV